MRTSFRTLLVVVVAFAPIHQAVAQSPEMPLPLAMLVDADGKPMRVVCDYCNSHHNYRGGPRGVRPPSASSRGRPRGESADEPFDLVGEKERSAPPMSHDATDGADLEMMLRRALR